MPFLTPTDRQRRIIQLSQEWRVDLPPAPAPLTRPHNAPSFWTQQDDETAEHLMHDRAAELSRNKQRSSLSKAFSSNSLKKGKHWDPHEVLQVLTTWIANAGAPGVAEALISKLAAGGFDFSGNRTKQKSGILHRRKSIDTTFDQAKLLKLAVQGNQYDMLQVLLPHADSCSIDQALVPAISSGNVHLAELLLRHGACASQTPEGQLAFRQACTEQNRSDLVGLILRYEGAPTSAWTSVCMSDASKAACLDTVLYLSRSTADGNHNQGEALKTAIVLGRKDIALAILMGNKPPQGASINEAFQVLHQHPSIDPPTRLAMAELLLCAGAHGDVVSQALASAFETHCYDMAKLLARYGASIEYNDAVVLKAAVAHGELDLINALLTESAKLSPALASSCVPLIAKQAPFQTRSKVLTLLMIKGANGVALDEMLIDAAEAGDIDSVNLLLNPAFPQSTPVTGAQNNYLLSPSKPPRHGPASVDHKSGEALRTAVLRADKAMTARMLSQRPTTETLSAVFPLTKKLAPEDRHEMVQLFLSTSSSLGHGLHTALRDAINEEPSKQDSALIKLLLEHDADINHDQGSGLAGVIKQKDMSLLKLLLEKASPQTAAARIVDAMKVSDHGERFEMVSMLINAGAIVAAQQIVYALLQTLSERPVDVPLLKLLLEKGGADINLLGGSIIKKSVSVPNPKILEMVFGYGKPSPSSVTCAFSQLAALPSTDSKARKLRAIISRCTQRQDLDWALVHEVQSVFRTDKDKASLLALKILLDGGANPNAFKAAALCHAVVGGNSRVTDMLFEAKVPPTCTSLGAALPHVLRITDPTERLMLTKKLVEAGPHPLETNQALAHAVKVFPNDMPLQGVLAAAADTSDGKALSLSVAMESAETMDLLLAKSQSSMATRSAMLSRATEVKKRATRHRMCGSLLELGVSKDSASSALLVASRDVDVDLCALLVAHGASAATNNGQAIVEACRLGSADVLGILVNQESNIPRSTLESGFQAATEIRDLSERAVIFECLLRKGLNGDIVNAQLVSAARYGDDGEAVLRVLLAAGADPNFNGGECVVSATRSAFIGTLELLLGLWNGGCNQKKVTQSTLARSLKACWDLDRESRFRIMSDLLDAGLQATEDLHMALNAAVNEDDPEERLVQLLLDHGASPAARGCKTLVDATNAFAPTLLALLLQTRLPQRDVSRALNDAFAADSFSKWFTEPGFETASVLLGKGAHGDPISSALVLVMKRCTSETQDLADRFVTLLVSHGADANYNQGEPLQLAASKVNVLWTKQLLERGPTIETLSSACQCIFDTVLAEDEVLDLFKAFADYRDGDVRIDVLSLEQGRDPVLVRAISQYPRSVSIVKALLDAGLYHDQATTYQIYPEIEDAEAMTLLVWTLAQPQKRVSNGVIELLLARGARVNVESSLSHTTPLMLAIQTRRPDLVKRLLLDGAEVDVLDHLGRTPLSMATQLGGDISVQMMSLVLAADPSRDDGSLHNAASDMNLAAVKVLVQAGHDPDFPSPLHEGRSALAELCLHGSDGIEMGPERERTMQKLMTFLIDCKSDVWVKSNDKTLVQLCFEAADPLVTTKSLLKSGMWKHINKPFNYLGVDGHVYSPTMYIKKVLPQTDLSASLLSILKTNRANDVYYALSGPQPRDAVGLPEDLAVRERMRKARLERLVEETEDFSTAMARRREMASVEQRILAQRAEMEDVRRRKLHSEEVNAVRSRAQLEESLASAAHARRMQEHGALAESSISRRRALAAAEVEIEEARQRKALEWETKLNTERMDNTRALGAIRLRERQEVARLDAGAEARITARIEAQRRLVESQEKLAKRLADGAGGVGMGDGRRQIGYVSEL